MEAKRTGSALLAAKEQARDYATSLNCRFVILSNGLQHHFWDLHGGNPEQIARFPAPDSIGQRTQIAPADPQRIVAEHVDTAYIALAREPNFRNEAWWRTGDDESRNAEIAARKLRFMRQYQVDAVHAIQRAVEDGNSRFLIEMATGTGKTLTAAAIIRLFMNSGNARKVMFLVDRLELEAQAAKALDEYLGSERSIAVYKRARATWQHADIVISTVQTLLANNRYLDIFSPTDFDLVISDEAHRSISGISRAVFEHFIGYKLGLTATPKDYLRGADHTDGIPSNPRELERRELLDTYKTFGCASGNPTYRYPLLDGVSDGFLVHPTTVDAKTGITTQLLSDEGLHATYTDQEGETKDGDFSIRDFERSFFSDATNRVFCESILDEGMRDPISGEFGKSIIYTVSQRHAAEITKVLNELATVRWPGRYDSDFAVQVTSSVRDAQQFARDFANNNLRGSANFLDDYRTSKARVCVTVGMMTTGYDCPDLLNLGLFRPIFSPTEFIQIKGRGTRKHNFSDELPAGWKRDAYIHFEKTTYKLFDFFGNFEYFEHDHDYDEQLRLPSDSDIEPGGGETKDRLKQYVWHGDDHLAETDVGLVGPEGMKVDRAFFDRFKLEVSEDPVVVDAADAEDWDRVAAQVQSHHFDRPEDYFNLPKLRRALGLSEDVPLREILEFALERIGKVKTREERAEDAFDLFLKEHPDLTPDIVPNVQPLFVACATNDAVLGAIRSGDFAALATNPAFTTQHLTRVPDGFLQSIPDWIDANFTRKG